MEDPHARAPLAGGPSSSESSGSFGSSFVEFILPLVTRTP
jgi:hypothetical protein